MSFDPFSSERPEVVRGEVISSTPSSDTPSPDDAPSGTSRQRGSTIPPYQPGPPPPYQDGSRVPPHQQGQVPPFGVPFRVHVRSFGTRGPHPDGAPFGPAAGPPLVLFGRKSVLLAGLLGLLGPIGMIYATFIGSLGMAFLLFVSLLAGGSEAVATLWILCPLWAMLAAYRRNALLDRLGVPR